MSTVIHQPIRKILVLRPDRLGDVILTLPAVRNLHEAYPEAEIFYLCTDYTAEILRVYSLISDVIIYKPTTSHRNLKAIRRLVSRFSNDHFDLAVHLLPRLPLALAAFLSGIKYNIGTGFRWYSFLYSDRLYEHRKYNRFHEAEYNLNLLKIIGLSSESRADAYSYFDFPSQNIKRIDSLVESEFKTAPFIIIHPGSGGSSIDWPIELFIELMRMISASGKYRLAVTGVASEKELLAPLYEAGIEFFDWVGHFGLIDLALLLKKSSLFISNSTGPLHLAVAMGTPVLGFYPNRPGLGPGRWGPYNRTSREYLIPPIIPDVSLNDERNNQMEKITPKMAYQRIKEILDFR